MYALHQSVTETLPTISAHWAERLARSRTKYRTTTAHGFPPERISEAIWLLWRFIDEAVAMANAALARWGLPDRIVAYPSGYQYWLSMKGPDESERNISVFLTLRARQNAASGGVLITTSQRRAALYLVPALDAGQIRWIFPDTGMPFTAGMVGDLFLSVFGEDPVAAGYLS